MKYKSPVTLYAGVAQLYVERSTEYVSHDDIRSRPSEIRTRFAPWEWPLLYEQIGVALEPDYPGEEWMQEDADCCAAGASFNPGLESPSAEESWWSCRPAPDAGLENRDQAHLWDIEHEESSSHPDGRGRVRPRFYG